jgi:hypothetical protein
MHRGRFWSSKSRRRDPKLRTSAPPICKLCVAMAAKTEFSLTTVMVFNYSMLSCEDYGECVLNVCIALYRIVVVVDIVFFRLFMLLYIYIRMYRAWVYLFCVMTLSYLIHVWSDLRKYTCFGGRAGCLLPLCYCFTYSVWGVLFWMFVWIYLCRPHEFHRE